MSLRKTGEGGQIGQTSRQVLISYNQSAADNERRFAVAVNCPFTRMSKVPLNGWKSFCVLRVKKLKRLSLPHFDHCLKTNEFPPPPSDPCDRLSHMDQDPSTPRAMNGDQLENP